MRFDLATNPFAILGVGIRAKAEEIDAAFATRLFDGDLDEELLETAKAELLVDQKRLGHELAWLPELTPAKARKVLATLTADHPDLEACADELTGLSRVNTILHLIGRRLGNRDYKYHQLLAALEELNLDAVRTDIAAARVASRFSRDVNRQWHSAWESYFRTMAETVHGAIVDEQDGPTVLSDLVYQSNNYNEAPLAQRLIEDLVNRYDRWSVPRLEAIKDELVDFEEMVRARPTDTAAIDAIETKLDAWDLLSQPVQLRDEAKGLDEPRSKELLHRLRSLALWLANKKHEYRAALQISLALQRVFPELPGAASTLAEDISTLEGLIGQQAAREALGPLIEAVERARADLGSIASNLLTFGFDAGADGPAATIREQLIAATQKDLSDPDAPWFIVRSLAIDLNNAGYVDAAEALVSGMRQLAENASAKVKAALDKDIRTLSLNRAQAGVSAAVSSGNLKMALDHAETVVRLSSPSDRADAEQVRNALRQRVAQQSSGRGWWVAASIIAGLLFLASLDNGGGGKIDYGPGATDLGNDVPFDMGAPVADPVPDYGDPANEMYSTDQNEFAEPAPPSDDVNETPPPPFSVGTLTRSQVRYCQFERLRMDEMERVVRSGQYSRFNSRVDDFNRRCGNYDYLVRDLEVVQSELAVARPRLQREARATVASWNPSPTRTPSNRDDPSELEPAGTARDAGEDSLGPSDKPDE